MTWTTNKIKDAVRATGSHWFDPDTMRCFGTKVLPTVYQGPGGIYFVTSDDDFERNTKYTVRRFEPQDSSICTVGDFASMGLDEARKIAKRAAVGRIPGFSGLLVPPEEGGIPYEMRGLKETTEEFKEISVLDQFAHDLQKHTNPARGTETKTVELANVLMKAATLHHEYMELLCSDEAFCRHVNADGEHPAVNLLRQLIEAHAAAAECKGVIFEGDPRGCTVKLVFKDGFTNDTSREGYCVPINDD
jgi:hypothetical protein